MVSSSSLLDSYVLLSKVKIEIGAYYLKVDMTIDTLPFVFLIISSFDRCKFLEDIILSVRSQDYPNIRYKVVYMCSKDVLRCVKERMQSSIRHSAMNCMDTRGMKS
jgi:hypothetical protein